MITVTSWSWSLFLFLSSVHHLEIFNNSVAEQDRELLNLLIQGHVASLQQLGKDQGWNYVP